ncbi:MULTISPECIES: peroxiredoxin-like family protein [Flavobacterium]|uniref:thioredoxin-dependent peroxiredoxin n=1 Tax=Flavobacterium tructae TaxID=1114873 RepID=A0A1S1J6U2_9FLAO|nr:MULTISPECIES: peroxiredoxin-like family protein [Flavobacterium]MDL2142315.1 peroxiredoxin-like family protein [Flavobacterium tructae]OHT45321.1 alkyl hydroperoxide reductase [Flavobacterium tructae]OXB17736.1 alkyl hydroperoxide reductase [Flavobacterium tructae]
MKNLAQQIEELNENLGHQLPREALDAFGKSIQDLRARNMEGNSIQTGDMFPDFKLPNTNDETVQLKEILKKGKVIAAFFRGSWCPYCSLELKALQDSLKQITDRKATLVAISPQKLDYSQELKSNYNLDFELLTDKNNALAKQLGISFGLQDYIVPTYRGLGIDLSEYNENGNSELPIPAVFVVDTNGSVRYKFADANYMNRIDIQELIKQL